MDLPINSIICGDCLEILKDFPDNCVDLVLTDIPYGGVTRSDNGLRNLNFGEADIVTFDLQVLIPEFVRISKGSIYVFCGTEQVSEIRRMMVKMGLSTRLLIWEKTQVHPMNCQHIWLSSVECCVYGKKPGAVFNDNYRSCVLRYKPGKSKELGHPTVKPTDLFLDLATVSSDFNNLILDPFCGSGTTCVTAKMLGRRYIGIDISEKYCNIARMRLKAVDTGVPVKEQRQGQGALFE